MIRARCEWYIDREIPTKSKPGVPYSVLGNSNLDILQNNKELIGNLVIARLKLLASVAHSELKGLDAEDLVRRNFCDPVRVFVKGEPHSTRKVTQSRWRLIFAVSVVDQLVERILCTSQNKTEIKTWNRCPSAPGLGLSDDDQLAELYSRVMEKKGVGDAAEADVTGFDWSVKEWELLWEAETRAKLGDFDPIATTILMNRELCVSRSVYAMPNGEMIKLKTPGVQLSGRYNTSSTNSRIRVLLAYLAGARWAIAMGDDSVEEYVPEAESRYATLGHPLKMYVRRTNRFEFCSQLFTPEGAWPVDGTKTLYRLLEQKQITPELVAQFAMELRNSPRLEEFLASVDRVRDVGGQETLSNLRTCPDERIVNDAQIDLAGAAVNGAMANRNLSDLFSLTRLALDRLLARH